MKSGTSLAEYLAANRAGYDALRDDEATWLAETFPADLSAGERDRSGVGDEEAMLAQAALAAGGRDAGMFSPLIPAAVREVAALDRADPDAVRPNLSVLGVVNSLQIMGAEVPDETVRTGTGWLAGMQTAQLEHEWIHWTRGLAALGLDDLATARTIAALPETGTVDVDPDTSPEFNIQGWLALFVAAVERGLPWERLRPRWEEFLLLRYGTFVEIRMLDRHDLPWLGRILGHRVAGVPLGQVADWLHAEVHRVAGLDPRA